MLKFCTCRVTVCSCLKCVSVSSADLQMSVALASVKSGLRSNIALTASDLMPVIILSHIKVLSRVPKLHVLALFFSSVRCCSNVSLSL